MKSDDAAVYQSRVERHFSNIANAPHADPLPEAIELMRDLFDYVKAIDKNQVKNESSTPQH